MEGLFEGSLRGTSSLSKILPLPLVKGKGIQGMGLLKIEGGEVELWMN